MPNADLRVEYIELADQTETKICEWAAAVLSVRRTRHGEPYVNLVDTLSEAGVRFRQAVQEFVAVNPNAKTDDACFPVYSI